MAKECEQGLQQLLKEHGFPLEILRGKMNLEVRPQGAHKGKLVERLIESLSKVTKISFVFCAGDDTTDEDMFAALHERKGKSEGSSKDKPIKIFSSAVGGSTRPTLARYHVDSPDALVGILGKLAGV